MRRTVIASLLSSFLVLPLLAESPVIHEPHDAERHLSEVRQLTFGGQNAEAYWSPDGSELIFQATNDESACDQIYRMDVASGESELVSTGLGRTTCAYFDSVGERIYYSSTHESDEGCPADPDHSQGYVWPIYPGYEIYSAATDGSDLQRLTENEVYDAEATVCPVDGAIIFTSTRDGDLELYRMDADGSNLQRLTNTPGYDGGAFFSRDCSKIVWRSSRPTGDELTDFNALLARDLVRPSKLEIFVADADGANARQVTNLGSASFGPYFYPSAQRIIFSSNYGSESGREFDLWAVDVDGTNLERITHTESFDGFPMFSPDGRSLAFASNRHNSVRGETNLFIARWLDGEAPADEGVAAPSPATSEK